MTKFALLLAAAGACGCSETTGFKPARTEEKPPIPLVADDPYNDLATIADDTVHDNVARNLCMRLHEQGKDREAVQVAGRIRNAQVRGATLTELQVNNLRQIGDIR